jgi:hypothetical protein
MGPIMGLGMLQYYLRAFLGALLTMASAGFFEPFVTDLLGARTIRYDHAIILDGGVAIAALIVGVLLFAANFRAILRRNRL